MKWNQGITIPISLFCRIKSANFSKFYNRFLQLKISQCIAFKKIALIAAIMIRCILTFVLHRKMPYKRQEIAAVHTKKATSTLLAQFQLRLSFAKNYDFQSSFFRYRNPGCLYRIPRCQRRKVDSIFLKKFKQYG